MLWLAAFVSLVALVGETWALPMGQPRESRMRAAAGLAMPAPGERGPAAAGPGPVDATAKVPAAALRHDAVRAAATAGGMPAMRVLAAPAVGEAVVSGDALRSMLIRIVLAGAAMPRAGSHLDELLYNLIEPRHALCWEGSGPGLAAEDSSLDLPESVAPGMAAAARRPGLLGAAVPGPRVGGMSEASGGGAGAGAGADRGGDGKKAEPVLRSMRYGGRTVYIIRDESTANAPPE